MALSDTRRPANLHRHPPLLTPCLGRGNLEVSSPTPNYPNSQFPSPKFGTRPARAGAERAHAAQHDAAGGTAATLIHRSARARPRLGSLWRAAAIQGARPAAGRHRRPRQGTAHRLVAGVHASTNTHSVTPSLTQSLPHSLTLTHARSLTSGRACSESRGRAPTAARPRTSTRTSCGWAGE